MKKISLFFLLIFAFHVYSHEFNPAHLNLKQSLVDNSTYTGQWMYPVKNIGKRATVVFPEICSVSSGDLYVQGKYIVEDISLSCKESLKGSSIEIVNLSVLTDALITINFSEDVFEGLINVQQSKILIPSSEQYYPTSYLFLGISHLFEGLDHILFIFGLLFCISGLLNIIKTITAFTIAHSITLGLSIYGHITLPSGTIESLIALTIIFLALEIHKDKKELKSPWIMAFGFGLLHGLGFAGALGEIGISDDRMLLSLLFFNIGIELAQISLIPIPLIAIYIAKKLKVSNYLYMLTSIIIGGMGAFWFIDRVIGIVQ